MTPARPSRWAESKLQQHNHGVQWACTVGAQTHAWGSSKDKGWGQQGSEAACELSINCLVVAVHLPAGRAWPIAGLLVRACLLHSRRGLLPSQRDAIQHLY